MFFRVLYFLLLNIFFSQSYAFHLDSSKQTIQLGGTMNTGNSDTTNLTASFSNKMKYGRYSTGGTLDGQLANNRGEESARSLKGSANLNYNTSAKNFLFIKASTNYDKFATYDFINREAVGLGRMLIENEKQELSFEGGPGLVHRRVSGSNEFQNEGVINLSSKYQLHLSETAEFKQSFSVDSGRRNTHLEATSAISTKVIDNLALELSFSINHDTKIPPLSKNTKKTDTASKATIVYSF